MFNPITRVEDSDYQKYALVKPSNVEPVGGNHKYTRVVVDSRIRNKTLFPNPNDYEVPFDDDVYDVIKAQLIYIDIPFTSYMINSNFNQLFVSSNGSDFIVTMPTGDYTKADFVTGFQTALNNTLNFEIGVSLDPLTDSLIFISEQEFTFKFANKAKTLAMLMGFKQEDYDSLPGSPYNQLRAPFRLNFDYNNYIIMDIDQFDLLRSSDSELNKTFAVIPKNHSVFTPQNDSQSYIKYFQSPIPRMNKLRIRLYDRFGNAFDCQNQDHRFEMLITSFKQKGKYYNFGSS